MFALWSTVKQMPCWSQMRHCVGRHHPWRKCRPTRVPGNLLTRRRRLPHPPPSSQNRTKPPKRAAAPFGSEMVNLSGLWRSRQAPPTARTPLSPPMSCATARKWLPARSSKSPKPERKIRLFHNSENVELCGVDKQTMKGMRGTLRMALHALRRNVMRSVLTILGIVIGVAAVIAMMEIGQGSSYSVEQTIASLGANVIPIDPDESVVSGGSSGGGGKVTLTPEDAEAIRRECSAVPFVAPSVDCRAQVIYGNRNWQPNNILGTTPDFLAVRKWELSQGQPFTYDDVRSAAGVCLIGQTVLRQLFGDESPLGKEIRLRNVHLKIIRVLSRYGASMIGPDQ